MTNQPNNTQGDPAFNEMPTKAAQNQLHQALDEIRTQATQKALTLIERILENETRTGHPFTTIHCHLLLAIDELHNVINYYRNHKEKQQ